MIFMIITFIYHINSIIHHYCLGLFYFYLVSPVLSSWNCPFLKMRCLWYTFMISGLLVIDTIMEMGCLIKYFSILILVSTSI